MASTAWYVLATTGRDDFWVECESASQPTDGSTVNDFYTSNNQAPTDISLSGSLVIDENNSI